MKHVLVLFLIVSFLPATARAGEGEAKKPAPRKGWLAAQTAPDGNMIAGWLEYEKGKCEGPGGPDKPIEINTAYAFSLLDSQWRTGKGYYLYDNVTKTYFGTVDFSLFLTELKKIPAGSTMGEIATCTICCYDNLSDQQFADFEKVCEMKKFVREEAEHCCYCEASGLRWLDIPGKGPLKW